MTVWGRVWARAHVCARARGGRGGDGCVGEVVCIMVLTPSNPSCPAGNTDSALVGLPFAPLATNATIVPPGGPIFKPLAAPPPPLGEGSSGLEAWKVAVAAAVPAAAVAAAAVAAGVLLCRRGRRGLYASTGGSSQSGKGGGKAGKEADGNLEEGSEPLPTISALPLKVSTVDHNCFNCLAAVRPLLLCPLRPV